MGIEFVDKTEVTASHVACGKCGYYWWAEWYEGYPLMKIRCPNCNNSGDVIVIWSDEDKAKDRLILVKD